MATIINGEAKYAELDQFIDGLSDKAGSLITVLHTAQHIFGYIPSEVQNHIAHRLEIPASKVYGVVTFYSFFTTVPKGKIQVNACMGTACFVRGAEAVLEELEKQLNVKTGHTSDDGLFSLDSLRCVGACGLAPVISINGKVYGAMTPEKVKKVVEEYMAEGVDA